MPVLIEKEMDKMKIRTNDVFFGLFSKEDMNPFDGDQIINYFNQNYDEITSFFGWFWNILQNLVEKGMDYKITKVESNLELVKVNKLYVET